MVTIGPTIIIPRCTSGSVKTFVEYAITVVESPAHTIDENVDQLPASMTNVGLFFHGICPNKEIMIAGTKTHKYISILVLLSKIVSAYLDEQAKRKCII